MRSTEAADVVIVGAGPVGLFGVFQCGMLNMRCVVVDSLDTPGGQCAALYPDKPIFDIPACPTILAGELVDRLVRQAAPFEPTYRLGETVEALQPLPGDLISVGLSSGKKLIARAVIVAAGAGAMGPNRPPLAGIEGYEPDHVLYRVADIATLNGRRVVVAGGGDSPGSRSQ